MTHKIKLYKILRENELYKMRKEPSILSIFDSLKICRNFENRSTTRKYNVISSHYEVHEFMYYNNYILCGQPDFRAQTGPHIAL